MQEGCTPLHIAVTSQCRLDTVMDVVRALLAAGADKEAKDKVCVWCKFDHLCTGLPAGALVGSAIDLGSLHQ